jgi:hypothetical protein|tara:strand:- start:418 stop:606 length:189 start_codon:yes stop_codon:yes gene_type:complete
MIDKLNPMPYEPQTWIDTLWEALYHARDMFSDEDWDQICMAMAWNTEELECVDPMEKEENNG